jgi:hypothetical protein
MLLKCGFTKHVTIGGYFFFHECGFRIDLIMGDFKILNYDKCKVDYLHQVQNTIIQRRDKQNSVTGDVFEIIDGKQRLNAMESFFNNEFTLLLEGNEYYFNELPEDYQSVIGGHHVMAFVVYDEPDTDITDQEKIDWFCMINFGGTPQDIEHMNKLK